MKMLSKFRHWLVNKYEGDWARLPDLIIGGLEDPYLYRWYVIPRNRWFNVYVHCFMRSDNDCFHDHPWMNFSWILKGRYTEHLIKGDLERQEGQTIFRWCGEIAHWVELKYGPCWTLFFTGPKYREWGFHTDEGWVQWETYLEEHGERA
jgi:hypothetical protein